MCGVCVYCNQLQYYHVYYINYYMYIDLDLSRYQHMYIVDVTIVASSPGSMPSEFIVLKPGFEAKYIGNLTSFTLVVNVVHQVVKVKVHVSVVKLYCTVLTIQEPPCL